MEAGTHEITRKTSRSRIHARRNDLDFVCNFSDLSNCLSQMETNLSKFIPRKLSRNLAKIDTYVRYSLYVELIFLQFSVMYFTWNVDNTNVFVFEKLLVEICWNMVGIHNYYCRSHEKMYRKAYRSNNSKVSSIAILCM